MRWILGRRGAGQSQTEGWTTGTRWQREQGSGFGKTTPNRVTLSRGPGLPTCRHTPTLSFLFIVWLMSALLLRPSVYERGTMPGLVHSCSPTLSTEPVEVFTGTLGMSPWRGGEEGWWPWADAPTPPKVPRFFCSWQFPASNWKYYCL